MMQYNKILLQIKIYIMHISDKYYKNVLLMIKMSIAKFKI